MKPIIEVKDLSKCYKLGVFNARSLREEAEAFLARFSRKKREGIRQKGEGGHSSLSSLPSPSAQSTDFWALRDVSFDVQPGEVVGIIGRNGAGKSTLLKILSRITEPTSGEARIRGRVASLLEVGTGFHPELSGRENIFLNGAILGMTKAEIRSKFDEIVEFSGVEQFIDTPVKRYSSGMYVRLAFAVAAHLEPEILIVDEVLAVGDVEFQKKCIGKMKEVSGNEGRTVLFVSHNLDAVQNICGRVLYLKQGREEAIGPCLDIVKAYQLSTNDEPTGYVPMPPMSENSGSVYTISVSLEDENGVEKLYFNLGEPWILRVKFRIVHKLPLFVAAVGIRTLSGISVQTAWTEPQSLQQGDYEAVFCQKSTILCVGAYSLVVGLSNADRALQQFEALSFNVLAKQFNNEFIALPSGAGMIVNSMDRWLRKI